MFLKALITPTKVRQVEEPEPKLPPELERIIFLLAWNSRPTDAKNLLAVARRVRYWLCPAVFKVVIVRSYRHHRPMSFMDPSSFQRYGKYIKRLLIDAGVLRYDFKHNPIVWAFPFHGRVTHGLLTTILKHCPNLVDLWVESYGYTNTKNLIPTLSSLFLTRIAIHLPLLLKQLPRLSKRMNRAKAIPPIFPGVTHILARGAPFNEYSSDPETQLLSIHFPNLTHFAVNNPIGCDYLFGLRLLLERCSKLKVFIWWSIWRAPLPLSPPPLIEVDSRVVEIRCDVIEAWEMGATEGLILPDVWQRAALVSGRST